MRAALGGCGCLATRKPIVRRRATAIGTTASGGSLSSRSFIRLSRLQRVWAGAALFAMFGAGRAIPSPNAACGACMHSNAFRYAVAVDIPPNPMKHRLFVSGRTACARRLTRDARQETEST
ncbi:hypothetical protein [Burkholderia sp. NLJ2]|uniref:hypothetical protein n=1 Tax=Burkholderia sp. NLJ2 TaxID=3090699 RepID=UPI003C6BDD3D